MMTLSTLREKIAMSRGRMRGNDRGVVQYMLALGLAILGIVLIVAALSFVATNPGIWTTPTGLALLGLSGISFAAAAAGPKQAAYVGLLLAVVGGVILILHYVQVI